MATRAAGPPGIAGAGELRRIVVLAPNWLGDAVMALSAIDDVRRALPHAVVAVAARPSIAPLFAMVPGIGETLTIGKGDNRRAIRTLRDGAFDAALLLPNSFRTALLAWRAGIGRRWGYRTSFRGALLTRAVSPATHPRPPRLDADRAARAAREPLFAGHQAALYQELVRALGFPSGPLRPALVPPAGSTNAATALLRAAGWDGHAPLVALAPGAAYGNAKRWPAEMFAEVAASLAIEGIAPVLVGTPADRPSVTEVVHAMGGRTRVFDLTGQTDLPTLAGLLSMTRGLVSNDSGAMHLAAALNVHVTAVFGPTDEQATSPIGPATIVVARDIWCRPCLLRECPLTHACMRGVSAETVLTAARRAW